MKNKNSTCTDHVPLMILVRTIWFNSCNNILSMNVPLNLWIFLVSFHILFLFLFFFSFIYSGLFFFSEILQYYLSCYRVIMYTFSHWNDSETLRWIRHSVGGGGYSRSTSSFYLYWRIQSTPHPFLFVFLGWQQTQVLSKWDSIRIF